MPKRALYDDQTERINGYVTPEAHQVLEKVKARMRALTGWATISDSAAMEFALWYILGEKKAVESLGDRVTT